LIEGERRREMGRGRWWWRRRWWRRWNEWRGREGG